MSGILNPVLAVCAHLVQFEAKIEEMRGPLRGEKLP